MAPSFVLAAALVCTAFVGTSASLDFSKLEMEKSRKRFRAGLVNFYTSGGSGRKPLVLDQASRNRCIEHGACPRLIGRLDRQYGETPNLQHELVRKLEEKYPDAGVQTHFQPNGADGETSSVPNYSGPHMHFFEDLVAFFTKHKPGAVEWCGELAGKHGGAGQRAFLQGPLKTEFPNVDIFSAFRPPNERIGEGTSRSSSEDPSASAAARDVHVETRPDGTRVQWNPDGSSIEIDSEGRITWKKKERGL
jgi:hypothetical protein